MPGAVHQVIGPYVRDCRIVERSVCANLVAYIEKHISAKLIHITSQGRSFKNRKETTLIGWAPGGFCNFISVICISVQLVDRSHMLHAGCVIVFFYHFADFFVIRITGGHVGNCHVNGSVFNVKAWVIAVLNRNGEKCLIRIPWACRACGRTKDRVLKYLTGYHIISICGHIILCIRSKQHVSAVSISLGNIQDHALISPVA